MPHQEGESAEKDGRGDEDELRVPEQAEQAVRHLAARPASANRHQLHLLRRKRQVLPVDGQGRQHQRDTGMDGFGVSRNRVRPRDAQTARENRLSPAAFRASFGPGLPLHERRVPEVPFAEGYNPVDVEAGQLLGQCPDGIILRACQGRASPKGMPLLQPGLPGDRQLHGLLQPQPVPVGTRKDDPRRIQGIPSKPATA